MSEKKHSGGIDTDLVRDLAKVLAEQDLTEIEVEHGELRLRLARTPPAHAPVAYAHAAPHPAPLAQAAAPTPSPAEGKPAPRDLSTDPRAVFSPMVGTAYLAPEPGSTPFVKVGDTVKEGQTLLIVEAMKTFNPIASTRSGKVVEILVSDAQPVEYGEALMLIE